MKNTMVELSIANSDDMDAIAALHATSWQAIYRGLLSENYLNHDIFQDRQNIWQQRFAAPEPHQRILVAREGENLCGFICIYLDNHSQWGTLVENLHINRAYQGVGLGKQLLQSAAKLSHQQTADKGMYLEVLAGNQAAQTFYQKLGAFNARAQQWQAPDGSIVEEFVYRWQSVAPLFVK
ncbi:GNAT family N-acetyltransferase [Photobacterium alginatilyticum]|uniref:GNAT family N-acetyltransferase n=1 Tax=Photobacterium alginatilyticum TaxID=1775171 RepID=A0ABW9YJ83_9GAMM|nr:GNAT family N-acetyltransferase [Photobacterium alginatilyticum]NBI53803.1 GNAT family N-acetyltransferase [Photobacterium alginatilyticum]